MSSKQFLSLALALVLIPAAAFAGGPLLVFDPDNDVPYAYDTSAPVPVYTDLGAFGPVSNAVADAKVGIATSQWSSVATSSLNLSIAGDFSALGLSDITGANAGQVVGVENGPGIHVIYDSDGSVVANFFGAPPGVLGIASPDFAIDSVITESWVVINGSTVDAADIDAEYWTGVTVHEFGHSINLAHTQTNGAIIYLGDAATPDGCAGPYTGLPTFGDIDTMYPFIDPSPGSIGLDVQSIDHLDDIAALSDIYPTAGWPSAFGTISGTVFEADGVTPVTGINVIVRNVNDPFFDANSQLSGNDTQGAVGPDGRFEFNGLTPGEEYVVYIDAIVDGGFSTTPTSLTFDEEWWNPAESADPDVDPVCDFGGIIVTAGSASNADIVLTDPGPVLPLGDDDTIAVALGFDFPFCDGNLYDTVFVNSNGSLTFGAGDTDFSESTTDFLAGAPRIAPLWDDLSPNEGGSVTAENTGGEFVVEFSGVPQFFTGDSNNFTVTLRPDGTYTIAYGDIGTQDAIIGRTEGNGAADPGSTDLSAETQPIGFGLQTIYQLFSVETIDLANQSFEFTPCQELPFPVLDVDTTPIVVDVIVDSSEDRVLAIGNAATPPAQSLEWSIDAAGVAPSSIVIEDGQRRTPLFEPVRSRFADTAARTTILETSPLKSERAFALKDLEGTAPEPTLDAALMAAGMNTVADGGFEAGAFAGIWNEFSLNFGSPVCDTGLCGTGTGTGPRTGLFWTWFGGIGAFEQGSMSQDVVIPAGQATLSFWLEQIICDSPADYMAVTIDGNEIYRTDGSSPLCGQLGYTEITIDLTALGYADGAVHTLEFTSEIFANNGGGSNFFLDDVSIVEEVPACDFLSVSPSSGTVAAGSSDAATLTFDATGLAAGTYECEVTVSSNGGSASIPVVMNVIDTVSGDLVFTDASLNGACSNSWLYVSLVPPDGIDPADISPDAVLVDGVPADPSYSRLVDLDGVPGNDALVVRFECNSVSRAIGCGDDIAVLVTSTLTDGRSIEFSGIISNGAVFDVTFGDSWDGTPLQQILDDEFGAGVVDAATGYEGFLCGDAITPYWFDNQVESWIVREIAGYSNQNEMGWYTETYEMPDFTGTDFGLIFTGADGAGATAVINLPGVQRFGLWMNPRGAGDSTNAPEPEVFFTNRNYNDEGPDGTGPSPYAPGGGDPQALIYNVTEQRGYPAFIIAWEDLDYGSGITPDYTPNSTDNDFNDLVVEIRAESPVSAVVANLEIQRADRGIRLNWFINGLELVDGLEVHRTDPSGAHEVLTQLDRAQLERIDEWTDTTADAAGTYYYQLAARVGEGTILSERIPFEQEDSPLVFRSQFRGAQPNPFNPQTAFLFSLSKREKVSLHVFDVSGRLVTEMKLGEMGPGDHRVTWNATDSAGSRVASGVYFVQMVTPSSTDRMRVVLLK